MPRAVIADQLGPLENYTLRAYDPGPPKPGQIRIAVRAAGVSFVDVLTAEGKYHVTPPTPFIPGSECAGLIAAVGAEVRQFSVGQRVVATGFGGIFAEVTNLNARSVWPMPQNMSFEEAAVFPVSYTTVWHALVDRGRLQAGEALLVLGAGGATGYAAVQIGKHLGARVIASASSEAKRQLALAGGADAAVNARSESWREDSKSANGGKPFDVVFDPVGGEATEAAFRTLGWNGRHLIVGFPGGISSLAHQFAAFEKCEPHRRQLAAIRRGRSANAPMPTARRCSRWRRRACSGRWWRAVFRWSSSPRRWRLRRAATAPVGS